MATNQGKLGTKSKELEQLIDAAVKKVGARKENDICRFIPINKGGYIHHFTMKKMKTEEPEQLVKLITKHIINEKAPKQVTPRPRRPRGSRKKGLNYLFTREDLDRIVSMARLAGDNEMVRKLSPRRDLRTVKRELVSSIRHGRIEPELWNAYVEVMTTQEAAAAASQSSQNRK
jgi:hypothetical protein